MAEEQEECFRTIAFDQTSSETDASRYDRFFMNAVPHFGLPEPFTEEGYRAVMAGWLGIPVIEVEGFILASTINVEEQLGPSTAPGLDADDVALWEEAWGRDFWTRWIESDAAKAMEFCDLLR